MTHTVGRATALLLIAAVVGCGDDDGGADPTVPPTTGDDGSVRLEYGFDGGAEGWTADYTDYTVDVQPAEFVAESGTAPPGMDHMPEGFFHVGSDNPSDDVFVYLRRPIEGLEPDTAYTPTIEVSFASAAPSGCAGIGGAPGESVYVKVGAATTEPVDAREGDRFRLSVDKGGQSQGGEAAVVVGNVANGIPCEDALEQEQPPFAMVSHRGTLDEPVTTDEDGRLWVFVGADSGFEGRTDLYVDTVVVELTPA